MSLRLRLTLMLGSAFVLLWALAATWMLYDLRGQMMRHVEAAKFGDVVIAGHGKTPEF